MRSFAFSCLAGLSSCFASELYSSMVLWKAVREADREPRAAGLRIEAEDEDGAGESVEAAVARGCEERFARSRRIEVLCFRALLKVVFCARSACGARIAKKWVAYHGVGDGASVAFTGATELGKWAQWCA